MRISRVALAFVISLFPMLAIAVPIAYVYNGVGSGSLGNVPFTNAAFTITAYADTSTIKDANDPSPGAALFNYPTAVTIAVSGFPTAMANGPQSFLQQMLNGDAVSSVVLKSQNDATLFLAFLQNLPFYDLASPFGPFTVAYALASPYAYIANNLPTSQGPLSLTRDTPTATFAGVLGVVPPPAPIGPAAPIPLSPWWAILGILAATLTLGRRWFD